MIYEFHDDKNGTAEEKRDKAAMWIITKYTLVADRGVNKHYAWNDFPAPYIISDDRRHGRVRITLSLKKGVIDFSVKNSSIYCAEMAYKLAKIFNEVETCCDMFDMGLI